MLRRSAQLLFLILILSSAGACGFKLRGSDYRLPESWQTLTIETRGDLSAHSGLTRELSMQLRQVHHVDLKPATNGIPKVVLLSEQFRSPVSALDQFGRAQEYLLEYIVYYQLVNSEGKDLLSRQRLYLRQEQTYSSKSILASEQENKFLRQQLYRRAANQILERLLATLQ